MATNAKHFIYKHTGAVQVHYGDNNHKYIKF